MSVLQRRRRNQAIQRWVVVVVLGVFFLLPLVAMAEFTTRGLEGHRTLATWRLLLDVGQLNVDYPQLVDGVKMSAGLVVLTIAMMLLILVPTMVWVRLRLPWLRRTLEFVCLLPLTIPAIVLVVGLAPIYRSVRQHLSLSPLQLFWAYAILALPYAYRALAAGLDAIDVRTLAEAARSLGAGWFTVMVRVVAPNMWQAILNAMLLTVALVLGEFTSASILLYTNLQVALYQISRATLNAGVLFSTSAASLLFAFLLLLVLSYVGRRRDRERG